MTAARVIFWSALGLAVVLAARRGAEDAVNRLVPDVPRVPDAGPLFDAPHQAPPLVRDLTLAEELARGLRPL